MPANPFSDDRPTATQPRFLARLLEHLTARATDPVVCVTPEGEVVWSNEAMAAALGRPHDELPGMRVSDFDDAWTPQAWADARRKLDEQGQLSVRTRFRRRDGSLFPVEIHSDRMDVDGRAFFFATIRDISASIASEERLRRQVEELDERRRFIEHMTNTSPDILWVYDLQDRRSLFTSRQFEREMGYSADELAALGEDILPRMLHPDDYARYRETILPRYRELADGEILHLRFRVRHRDGTWHLIQAREVIHVRNPDGTPRQVFGLARDVTERQRAEIRYRTVLRTSIDGFWMYDFNGGFLEVNDAYCAMSGYSREELLAMHIWDMDAVESPEETAAHIDLVQTVGHDRFETRHRRKDGSLMDIEVSVTMVPQSGGVCTAFIRDITERKQAQAAERQLREELERSSREMEQMLYVASHDLRSPLLSVQGFGSLLEYDLASLARVLDDVPLSGAARTEVDRVLRDVAPEALDFIGKGVQRMDGLLSGLLKVSRAGRVVATPRVLDMDKLVRKVTSAVEFQVRCSGVALSVGPLPPCVGDPAMMEQVLGNLLDNALKYLEPTRAARIAIRGEVRGDEAVYCVEDNGIGIAPEHVSQVFLMFHRLDPDRVQGEGIGLTIVRTLMERQGGQVWVESRPGEGSCFRVALAAARGPVEDPEEDAPG